MKSYDTFIVLIVETLHIYKLFTSLSAHILIRPLLNMPSPYVEGFAILTTFTTLGIEIGDHSNCVQNMQ